MLRRPRKLWAGLPVAVDATAISFRNLPNPRQPLTSPSLDIFSITVSSGWKSLGSFIYSFKILNSLKLNLISPTKLRVEGNLRWCLWRCCKWFETKIINRKWCLYLLLLLVIITKLEKKVYVKKLKLKKRRLLGGIMVGYTPSFEADLFHLNAVKAQMQQLCQCQ